TAALDAFGGADVAHIAAIGIAITTAVTIATRLGCDGRCGIVPAVAAEQPATRVAARRLGRRGRRSLMPAVAAEMLARVATGLRAGRRSLRRRRSGLTAAGRSPRIGRTLAALARRVLLRRVLAAMTLTLALLSLLALSLLSLAASLTWLELAWRRFILLLLGPEGLGSRLRAYQGGGSCDGKRGDQQGLSAARLGALGADTHCIVLSSTLDVGSAPASAWYDLAKLGVAAVMVVEGGGAGM
ncbi:MAG: hypothetical protein AB7L18_11545, partial [Hyphomicrobiaceae bacterium]